MFVNIVLHQLVLITNSNVFAMNRWFNYTKLLIDIREAQLHKFSQFCTKAQTFSSVGALRVLRVLKSFCVGPNDKIIIYLNVKHEIILV